MTEVVYMMFNHIPKNIGRTELRAMLEAEPPDRTFTAEEMRGMLRRALEQAYAKLYGWPVEETEVELIGQLRHRVRRRSHDL